MTVGLLTEDEVKRLLRERIDSRAWWVIPCLSESSLRCMEAVEERHYTGRASADFQVFLTAGAPAFAVATARKRRMSRAQLVALLREVWGDDGRAPNEEEVGDKDILLPYPASEDGWAALRRAAWAWHDWVMS